MTRDTSPSALQPYEFGLDTKYSNVIDVQFLSEALARGTRCVRGASWSTRAHFPREGDNVIASAYYEYNRSFEALAMVGGALAHVIRKGDSVTVRLAGQDQSVLDSAEASLRDQLPESNNDDRHRLAVDFCSGRDNAPPRVTSRTLQVPTLAEIERNYPAAIHALLGELAAWKAPPHGGRLLLWHGLPGCGKTWALRALASEWRAWCRLRCVMDPERLLGDPAYLVDTIHSVREGWQLIVLEDTGELLAADAKEQAGQGLSRLLNVVDGMLGESSRALFLVTTNEDIRSMHPAIARPGRCQHMIEFHAFQPDEANVWLERERCSERVAVPATLAELFALRDGRDVRIARRVPVGFADQR